MTTSTGHARSLESCLNVAEYEGHKAWIAVTQALAEGLRELASARAGNLTEPQIAAYERLLGENYTISGGFDLEELLKAAIAVDVTPEDLFRTLFKFSVAS